MSIITRIQQSPVWMKALAVIIVILLGWVAWWLGSPLFLDGETGSEDFSSIVDDENANVFYQGNFVDIDSTHTGQGAFKIIELSNLELRLYFIDVIIANGPDLVVYLSSKETFSSATDTPGIYWNLGDLPATQGNFSMSIPNNIELGDFRSVMIWCEPFEIVFTYATFMNP